MDPHKIISSKDDKATFPRIISHQISIIQLEDACFSTIHKNEKSFPELFTGLHLVHLTTTTIINSVINRVSPNFKISLGEKHSETQFAPLPKKYILKNTFQTQQ